MKRLRCWRPTSAKSSKSNSSNENGDVQILQNTNPEEAHQLGEHFQTPRLPNRPWASLPGSSRSSPAPMRQQRNLALAARIAAGRLLTRAKDNYGHTKTA